uniref:hypothetical protein n=1 Tax=Prevotella sp. TaxID=59823 RepID=UPI00402A4B4B
DEHRRACSIYAMARKGAMKWNIFVKPDEHRRACSIYAMARKGAIKWNDCALEIKVSIQCSLLSICCPS